MPPGGMSHNYDATEIEPALLRNCAKVVRSPPHIKVGSLPTAAGLWKSPVFDVPSSDAIGFQRVRHGSQVAQRSVRRLPAAAGDEYYYRVRSRGRRDLQLGVLSRILSLCFPIVRRMTRQRL